MKPGLKTTEFWMTLLVVVLTAVQPYFQDIDSVNKGIAIALSTLSVLGYTISRAYMKGKKDENTPTFLKSIVRDAAPVQLYQADESGR